jgi:hypothetical protein
MKAEYRNENIWEENAEWGYGRGCDCVLIWMNRRLSGQATTGIYWDFLNKSRGWVWGCAETLMPSINSQWINKYRSPLTFSMLLFVIFLFYVFHQTREMIFFHTIFLDEDIMDEVKRKLTFNPSSNENTKKLRSKLLL